MTQDQPIKKPKPKLSLKDLIASGAILVGSEVVKRREAFDEAAEYEQRQQQQRQQEVK